MNRQFSINCMVLLVTLVSATCSKAENPEEEATIGRRLETIEKASTFIQLLKNTDKAEALLFAPSGSTTVFVPTNDAFSRMDKSARKKLFDPKNKHWLERVLTYHAVHNSRVDSYIVGQVDFLKNGLGQYLQVTRNDAGDSLVDDTRIAEVDLVCSNGIVHFIDDVLDPVELDLFEQLENDGRFTILTKLITRSGLSKLFQNRHKVYTVFAPTDEAFRSLPTGTVEALMSPEKLDFLSDVIRSHIVEGDRTVGKIDGVQPLGTPGTTVVNQYNQFLIFRRRERGPTIDERNIIDADAVARNGFLHVIDRPLLPKRDSLADRLIAENQYNIFLDLCKLGGVYDLLGQFNQKITVFAPNDAAFESIEAKSLLQDLRRPENLERLRGILQRHFVRGRTILTTNSISFRRFQSALNARLDFERAGNERSIQGVDVVQTDMLARNGVAHGIAGVIPLPMEAVDTDQNWDSYRQFVRDTIASGSALYNDGELKRATDFYARRRYEFVARYGSDLTRLYGINASKLLNNDIGRNFQYDFASTAWRQRNGFQNLLRTIEQKQPLLIDELDLLEKGMKVIVVGDKASIQTSSLSK